MLFLMEWIASNLPALVGVAVITSLCVWALMRAARVGDEQVDVEYVETWPWPRRVD